MTGESVPFAYARIYDPCDGMNDSKMDRETGGNRKRRKKVTDMKEAVVKTQSMQEALRLAQRDLSQRTEAVKMANEELMQYASISSHDLKGPLRAIRNYCDFLCEDLEDILNEEQRKCLDGLERAVRQGEELVDDLIDFSRIGMWNLSPVPIDLGVFLKALIASSDIPADISVVIDNHWPTIDAEPTLLTKIFGELIDNAITFNHASEKRIEIGWTSKGDAHCELFVRDNGIGIEPRHQEQVFHMFQRLHSRLDYPGTGIGLATVRKATFKLHGSVRVESKPGEGSTFFVLLPKTQTKC